MSRHAQLGKCAGHCTGAQRLRLGHKHVMGCLTFERMRFYLKTTMPPTPEMLNLLNDSKEKVMRWYKWYNLLRVHRKAASNTDVRAQRVSQ